MSATKNVPKERHAHDVRGMPCYAAVTPLAILLGPESLKNSVPNDDENCAIAQGCRVQLRTPYVSVGRYRTDLALPHPKGVTKSGYGDTLWAVIRFRNPPTALSVIVAADLEELDDERGVVVELLPPKPSERPGMRSERNKRFRESKGVNDGRGIAGGNGQDRLTLLGVRTLTGQRKRR